MTDPVSRHFFKVMENFKITDDKEEAARKAEEEAYMASKDFKPEEHKVRELYFEEFER